MKRLLALFVTLIALCSERPCTGWADTTVSFPLASLQQLVDPRERERPNYAFSDATVNLNIEQSAQGSIANVILAAKVHLYPGAKNSIVRLLPTSVEFSRLLVDGSPEPVVAAGSVFGWVAQSEGVRSLSLMFRVRAIESSDNLSFAIPLVNAQAVALQGSAGMHLGNPTVAPSTELELGQEGGATRFAGVVPGAEYLYLSFRKSGGTGWSIGRVALTGEVKKEPGDSFSSSWVSEFGLDIFASGVVKVPLLPESVALREVTVDGASIPLVVEGGQVHALMSGKGAHKGKIRFDAPVSLASGVPVIKIPVTEAATRTIELHLPGKQEVSVEPAGGIERKITGDGTVVNAALPRTSEVALSWREALPDSLEREASVHVTTAHLFRVEEGILNGDAVIDVAVRQGRLESFEFLVPSAVQVEKISMSHGGLVDWRIAERNDLTQRVSIYFAKRLANDFKIGVTYDTRLRPEEQMSLPLIMVPGAERRRGVVGLIGTKDAALRVENEESLLRISEAQLSQAIPTKGVGKVTFAFKYQDEAPELTVSSIPPERSVGRFNTEIDSLFSVGEVGGIGHVAALVEVKTGSVAELTALMPPGPKILAVVAPSLRSYKVTEDAGMQRVGIEFTQEMEGRFPIEVKYEIIAEQEFSEIRVPFLHIEGADVDRGRLAIESRSATEVKAKAEEGLVSVDPVELPAALVARSSYPILRAYEYTWREGGPVALLSLLRHRKQDVLPAKIETAAYTTTVSVDGSVVTDADVLVRNIREQFLKVTFPEGSKIWTLSVDGKPETPVFEEGAKDEYLIKLVTKEEGFHITLRYSQNTPALGGIGARALTLPRLSLVTESENWTISLPDDRQILRTSANFDWLRASDRTITVGKRFSAEQSEFRRVSLTFASPLWIGLMQLLVVLGISGVGIFWGYGLKQSYYVAGLALVIVVGALMLGQWQWVLGACGLGALGHLWRRRSWKIGKVGGEHD